MRAPGMTWMRLPLFAWAIEAYAVMLVLVLPTISAAVTLLLLDRQTGTEFFAPENGGPVLWQHMFWFFGHPEVYIMVLPAMGMLSEIIPVFSRKPIFGYKAVAFSTIGIAFASMLVWAHHMFTIGMPDYLQGWFMVVSFSVAVPTAIKIFNWLATLWRGHLWFRAPLLFCLGFLALFTMGGLSGVMLAAYPVDYQAHDSYYVVAHFHYVLFGGTVFGVFAGTYYWFPKITGRMYDERLAQVHFWLMFIGFNAAFLPQHMLGLMGMQRRIYTYDRGGLFEWYNLVSSIGALPHGRRDPRLPRQRSEELAQRPARRQRPVAGRHARVVHHLAAAAAQLRQGALRLEPAAAARSAPAPERGTQMSPRPGAWFRLTALAGAVGVAAVVATGNWGLAHDVAAHVHARAPRRRSLSPPGSATATGRCCSAPQSAPSSLFGLAGRSRARRGAQRACTWLSEASRSRPRPCRRRSPSAAARRLRRDRGGTTSRSRSRASWCSCS